MMNILERPAEQRKDTGLEIYTLGRFKVYFDGQDLFAESSRALKIEELFMYLVTRCSQLVAPEDILEDLWPEQEYVNPRDAVKNLVYRLKQKLESHRVPVARSVVNCSSGCYGWNNNISYWLDAQAFENLARQARALAETDSLKAVAAYREALNLYRGDYLPEYHRSDWVLPVRHYYRNLFSRSLSELLELQKKHRLYFQMIEDCEKALKIEDLDENLHLIYMEALLNEGRTAQARKHYEYITSLFYQELGAKPSAGMWRIYRAIKAGNESPELNFTDLRDMLKEWDENPGALLCEPDYFRFLCKLEKRRTKREERPLHLGLLTLTGPDYQLPPALQLREAADKLREVLLNTLRQGDVLSPWNESQFIILLPGLNLEQAEGVLWRIKSAFRKVCPSEDIVLRSSAYPALPWE